MKNIISTFIIALKLCSTKVQIEFPYFELLTKYKYSFA